MNKVLAVIRREFIERVRTKAFIIGTLIVPVVMFGFVYLPQLLLKRDTRPRAIAILDVTSGSVGDSVEAALGRVTMGTGANARARYELKRLTASSGLDRLQDSLISRVGAADATGPGLDGLLVLTDQGVDSGRVSYYGTNVASFSDMGSMRKALEPALRDQRMVRQGADPSVIAAASVELKFTTNKVSNGRVTGESGESSFWLAYVTSFVMYFSLVMYGIQVMGAVLEEKSNRIMEVLVSSITPFQLLLGKVVGVASAGLLQLAIWASASVGASVLGSRLGSGSESGTAMDSASQSVGLPSVSFDLVVVILGFFLLGFLLYSALYASVGAMCSSQQETQQAAQPVTILLALGFITMFALINDPSSNMAKVLSFIPFFSPLVIPVRYALSPLPLSEVLGAAAVTLLGVLAVVWVAARIYRIGILSYGKRPSPKELWRWIRAS